MSTPAPETPVDVAAPVAPEVTIPVVVSTPPVVEQAPAPVKLKAGCPTCGGTLEKYLGSALHKFGTAFCNACGLRHVLKG